MALGSLNGGDGGHVGIYLGGLEYEGICKVIMVKKIVVKAYLMVVIVQCVSHEL